MNILKLITSLTISILLPILLLRTTSSALVLTKNGRGTIPSRCLDGTRSVAGTCLRQHRVESRSRSHYTPTTLFESRKRITPQGSRENRLLRALRTVAQRISRFPSTFRSRFARLSKRAKQLFVLQLLCITMIFGSLGRKVYVKYNNNSLGNSRVPVEVTYSNFMDLVEKSGEERKSVSVDNIRIGTDRISYRLTKKVETTAPPKSTPSKPTSSKEGKAGQQEAQMNAYTRKVSASPELIQFLREHDMPFAAAPVPRTSSLAVVARTAVLAFYLLILFRMYKTFTGNLGGGSGGSDAPGKLATPVGNLPLASFQDIQGIDDAKFEVMELVDTLRNPEKYAILGARAPTGLLLEGPPGTGKTMLARATAATAGVPLLYCSGSDFVEMFVGRGAARVRKLFERASKLSPCIIFVDELDALGKARDSPSSFMRSRGNDEAEQTLNQLLACMDGLDSTRRICVLGATNRKEVLDPALIRPGRFDRIVTLKLPDTAGREAILRVHAGKLPGFQEGTGVDEIGSLGKGDRVDLSAVAAVTSGLSGAELEFIVNESAIRAVRRISAAINQGQKDVSPNVLPSDFAASVQSFYETRKPNKDGINDLLKSMWK